MRAWWLVVAVCLSVSVASAQAPTTNPEITALDQTYSKQVMGWDIAGQRATLEKLVVAQAKLSGEDSIWTWRRKQALVGTMVQMGDFRAAIAMYKSMLAQAERLHGPESTEVRDLLGQYAGVLEMTRDADAAEAAFLRLLALTKKIHGEKSGLYAFDLIRYASFLGTRQEHVAAARLQEQAIALLGAGNGDVSGQLTTLALSYLQFDQAKAKATFDRYLASLAKQPPEVRSRQLWWVSGIYRRAGRLDWATPLEKQSADLHRAEIARIEKTKGKDGKELADPLWSLGTMFMEINDLASADPLITRAIAIAEKHKLPTIPYGALAGLRRKQGRAKEALALFTKAQATIPGGTGLYPMTADIERELGNTKRAEELYTKAQADLDKLFGKNAVLVMHLDLGLFAVHVTAKQLDKADAVLGKHLDRAERELSLVLASGTEADHLAYFTREASLLDTVIAYHARNPKRATAARIAMTTLLRRKGRMLDAAAASLGTLRARLPAADQQLLDQLSDARARLAKVAVGGAQMNPNFTREVAALSDQIQKLEVTLSRKNAELKLAIEPVALAAVQKAIPKTARLVEMINYQPGDITAPYSATPKLAPRRYAAYVLGPTGAPTLVDLGEAPAIEAAIAALRAALSDPDNDSAASVSKTLHDLTFGKLRAALGTSTQILIAPDGALNVVPFAALHDGKQYLVKQYTFTYLTSGRDLLRVASHAAAKGKRTGAIIFADPDFDGAKAAPSAQPPTRRSRAMQGLHWKRLPGTAEEADALEKSLTGATIYRAKQATEKTLKSLHGPRILHLATHGFFLTDADTSVENPLLRSGLVFAGANALTSGDDDGVVTALEASSLDLRGTGLVVLSACETGVGKIANGEGVYGLRRAFVIAGAESLVMSMWEVDDAATRDLMAGYYKKLEAGLGRSEGLRAIQLEMNATKKYAHPYYWASFIAAGDSAPLRK
jgi:CHAT domain-containing protein